MAITDLTGTKWVLKASLISYPGGTYTLKNYSVNITSDEATTGLNGINTPTDTFALLGVGYDSGPETNRTFMLTASNEVYAWAAGHDTKSLPDTWSSVLAIPFTITGGSDATNSNLIAWFEDNADQIIPRVEYLTDNIELTSIANAIRTKGGTSASLTYPAGFLSAIEAIPTGVTPTGTKQISIAQNGTTTEDVTNYASAEITVNVSGGGASNVVTGTFTGTTGDAAMDVNISYSGNGYPIAVIVFAEEGALNYGGTFLNTMQKYALCMYFVLKDTAESTPQYQGTGNADNASYNAKYKNSDTLATSMGNNGASSKPYYNDINASSRITDALTIRSKNKLSVYISATSGSYGFMANVEYRYVVFYSS